MTSTSPERAAEEDAQRTVERVAHDSYGRLLAFLAARSRDLAAAEDALADSFQAALESWPRKGVPEKPEAWLLITARRRLIDAARHAQVQAAALPALLAAADAAQETVDKNVVFPDERLKLLFICAHPAIDASVRTPLMLQIVLGLDAARIASAFLVQPSAMGQRLCRAKAKIRDAGIRFELPEANELPARLGSVLQAVYAAYGSGWEDLAGADPRRKGLALEAIDLGRLLLRLLPAEPEVQGLLALMLYCEARREARRTATGEYVPLSEQDVTLWSRAMIAEADWLLRAAGEASRLGRFQLEAAIQSVHTQRAITGETDWAAIAVMYEALALIAPTIGALIGRAAAVGEAHGARAGWTQLQAIPSETVKSYQPYWALAAHLLKGMGRCGEANTAYDRAIGLCEDGAVRDFLMRGRPA
ncbi:MAG: RNA polymerase subunit sigma-70 [Acidobacteriota bacterium]|nr:RNA polymerase subunit sigma-70 [Acidobacteriota bacterium]